MFWIKPDWKIISITTDHGQDLTSEGQSNCGSLALLNQHIHGPWAETQGSSTGVSSLKLECAAGTGFTQQCLSVAPGDTSEEDKAVVSTTSSQMMA